MSLEVATHPDDLCIVCAQTKEYPGKYATNFMRGIGARYRYLMTCDTEASLANSREEAIERIKIILEAVSIYTLYQGSAPESYEAFSKCIRDAGYLEDRISDDRIRSDYERFSEKGPNDIIGSMIDINRVLNAPMIDEIMERFKQFDTCDTSQTPLKTFTGPPTY